MVNDTVTIGTAPYTFVSLLVAGKTNQVKIATTFDGSMSNFIAAINLEAGSGSKYSTGTKTNTQVHAGTLSNHAFTVTARVPGTNGNTIATTITSAHLTWNGHTNLVGGVEYVAGSTNIVSFPYDNFINHGLISDQSSTIYANYFENGGVITNGTIGSFALQSRSALSDQWSNLCQWRCVPGG